MLPAIFFGHGSPMNAITSNGYTEAWRQFGEERPRPQAVLAISAHWYIPGTAVTAVSAPRTIHDFRGFPPELYQVRYPAPGDPALAERVRDLLAPLPVELDHTWGLDHGTWSVLRHVYPAADVPIVQLGIDATRPASFHFELGSRLAPLRSEGVLIAGSGNLVHNLRAYARDGQAHAPAYAWDGQAQAPYDWAVRFEAAAKQLIVAADNGPLIDYESLGPDAMRSIPTPEHYLPLLYVLGTRQPGEAVSFPVEGTDGGSISMLAVQVG